MAKNADKTIDFSLAMQELEQIVTALEKGELSLDQAISQYEKGAKLASQLQDYLTKAELKIKQIKATSQDSTK